MIHILEVRNQYTLPAGEYIYVSDQWVSSNFGSLEQLIEVGFDDPDKEPLTSEPSVYWQWEDTTLLITVSSFEELLTDYPELFI